MKTNNLLKLGIFILGCLFLVLYYQSSQIGRYQSVDSTTVVDTKTGKIFYRGELRYSPEK